MRSAPFWTLLVIASTALAGTSAGAEPPSPPMDLAIQNPICQIIDSPACDDCTISGLMSEPGSRLLSCIP